jgi:6-pyruvoyltetrahydropterin/6-carboxytetrahydropterin synthase
VPEQLIEVRHNIEVAHRLYQTPGKCENIHGHSMWVTLKLCGAVDKNGILEGLEFGEVKRKFRSFLDEAFDHHLLLNEEDPWAHGLYANDINYDGAPLEKSDWRQLPGLMTTPDDPTTENLARWIGEWAEAEFRLDVNVHVRETHVNAAEYLS